MLCVLCSNTCSEPVNRVGLHHFTSHPTPPSVAQQERVVTARTFCSSLLTSALLTHDKLRSLDMLWSEVVGQLVRAAVHEYQNMDQHMKAMLENLH